MDAQNILSAPRAHFHAVLLPHRSLGRKGFVALMLVVCAVSALTGAFFLMQGAWLVTSFFGLELLLIPSSLSFDLWYPRV